MFRLLGSTGDPPSPHPSLFKKVFSPQLKQSKYGAVEQYLGGGGGSGVGAPRAAPLAPLRGVKVSLAEGSLGMAVALPPVTRPRELEQSSSPGWVDTEARRKACCGDCLASKAPRGRGGGYQKIVVSYLVLMPLLASCPGSTIHGRLARVFCSEGSICFKTERLMPVIRQLGGGAAAWAPLEPHLGPRLPSRAAGWPRRHPRFRTCTAQRLCRGLQG